MSLCYIIFIYLFIYLFIWGGRLAKRRSRSERARACVCVGGNKSRLAHVEEEEDFGVRVRRQHVVRRLLVRPQPQHRPKRAERHKLSYQELRGCARVDKHGHRR